MILINLQLLGRRCREELSQLHTPELNVEMSRILAKRTSHVAGGEEDRARSFRAAEEELLAGVMEIRADPRSRGEFAGAELSTCHAVDAAVPWIEIAVGEHAIGKLAA